MRSEIIGRHEEKEALHRLWNSEKPELLALYGRRRVGKTFLIREYFQEAEIYFELTGQQDAPLAEQLRNFAVAFGETFLERRELATPVSWREALRTLADEIDRRSSRGRVVVFFDELPWLASRRSGFLAALDHFWNAWASKKRNLLVVVCGSAASWMIRELLHHKGGLHNRVTARIRLLPFALAETEEYLASRGVHLDRTQILELYMAVGGIPHYLSQVERGVSAAQSIDRICFTKDGFLSDEYDRLYHSLFEHAERHMAVIQALARKRAGLSRGEILRAAELGTGGTATKVLRSLEESGFVASTVPFGKKANESRYRLADEYSLFYLTWIQRAPRSAFGPRPSGYWLQQRARPAWRSWAGHAFEALCLKHVQQIKQGLGINGISTMDSGWYCRPGDEKEKGTQIDLLIDRSDNCISLCEMKFADAEFVINKAYADALRSRRDTFRNRTRTRKTLFLVMVTTHGTSENRYCAELVDQQLTMDTLFLP